MADTESTNPVPGVDKAAPSIEERMQTALFGKTPERKAPAAKEAAAEPAPPEAEAANPTDSQDSPEPTLDDLDAAESTAEGEQPAVEDAFEIVHNGKQHKLTREETIKLAQQGFDYTQKTQSVAAKEKQVQEALDLSQQVMQIQIALSDDLAQVKAFEKALQPYQNVDWVALATQEPLEYPKYRAQYDQLINGYNAAAGQYKQKAGAVLQGQQVAAQKLLGEEAQKLSQLNPRWSKPDAFQADAKQIAEYGIKEGYQPEEMNSIRDARYVNTLWKAMQYDRLVEAKAGKVKLMQKAAPMARPGSTTGQNVSADKDKQLRDRLRKTGSEDAAVALLLNRMK